jgi:hypothetical protein
MADVSSPLENLDDGLEGFVVPPLPEDEPSRDEIFKKEVAQLEELAESLSVEKEVVLDAVETGADLEPDDVEAEDDFPDVVEFGTEIDLNEIHNKNYALLHQVLAPFMSRHGPGDFDQFVLELNVVRR